MRWARKSLFFLCLNSRYCLFHLRILWRLAWPCKFLRLVCDQESPIRTLYFANFIVMNTKKEIKENGRLVAILFGSDLWEVIWSNYPCTAGLFSTLGQVTCGFVQQCLKNLKDRDSTNSLGIFSQCNPASWWFFPYCPAWTYQNTVGGFCSFLHYFNEKIWPSLSL